MSDGRQLSSWEYVNEAFQLLPRSRRRKLLLVALALALVSILDLVALLLVLGVTALGTGSSASDSGLDRLPGALRPLVASTGLTSVGDIVTLIGAAVIALFVLKAVLATRVLRRVLLMLARQESELTHSLARQLMAAPLTFHLRRRYLDEMTDITVGVESLVMKAVAPTVLLGAEAVLITLLVSGLIAFAPAVAAGAVLYFGVVFTVMVRSIGRRARAAGEADVRATRNGMIVITAALAGFREVTTRGVSEYFTNRIDEIRKEGSQSRAEVAYLGILPRYFLEASLVVGMGVIYAVQLPFVGFSGAMAGLTLFAVVGFRLLPSLLRVQGSLALMRAGQPFGERGLTIAREVTGALKHVEQPRDSCGGRLSVKDGVRLEKLCFSYPGASSPALSDVDAHFPAKRMTALVGASGSGKSTLVDVLLGLLPPTAGLVTIDGLRLVDVRPEWLRSVGYVPQSVYILTDTVRANVALGIVEPDEEAVWKALARASLDDVVEQLPGALDFVLGDGGGGLSGGQRQRLGIARALYDNPTVLILDEATSALDVETEAEITETLAGLADLTKIVVAHRLSTVRDADQVLFLRRGRAVAAGTWTEVSTSVPDFARQVALSGISNQGHP